jgi:hypothetical protein
LWGKLFKIGDKTNVEVFEVEPTGGLATPSIQQTTRVKAGDIITGVLGSNGRIAYIAGIPEGDYYVAEEVVNKVADAQGPVRLQLERAMIEVIQLDIILYRMLLS